MTAVLDGPTADPAADQPPDLGHAPAPARPAAIPVGSPAPEVTLPGLDDEQKSLA